MTTLFGNAAFVLLGLAVLALATALVVACQSLPANPSSRSGSAAADSAASQTVNARLASGQWIAIASTSPTDVVAAARQSSMLQQNLVGNGENPSNLSRLGSPVFVRALQPAGAAAGQFPDFYVVPILDTAGAATDAAELQLNPSRTAIQVVAIVTFSQPHPLGAISLMTATQAIAAVQVQEHIALRASALPEQVYFPADAAALQSSEVTWTAGGAFPADPIWLVPGADGRDHLVGDDGRTYTPDQLPMVKLG
jgi:hypothetical protein